MSLTPEHQEQLDIVKRQITTLQEGHAKLNSQMVENTELTQGVKKDTEQLVALFKTGTAIFNFIETVGTIAKFVTYCGVCCMMIAGAVYAWITHSTPPSPPSH